MLRSLAVAAVVLASLEISAQSPRQPGKQPNHAQSNQSESHYVLPPSPSQGPINQAVTIDHEDKGEEARDHSKTQTGYWEEAFSPPYAANWALVLIGLLAAGLAWFTLRRIADQAKSGRDAANAAKDGAEAALLNAKAVMNAERAWVDVRIYYQPTLEEMRKAGGILGVTFKFINTGRTPAKIARSYIRAIVVDSLDPTKIPVIPKLEDEPVYGAEGKESQVARKGDIWLPRNRFHFLVPIDKDRLFGQEFAAWRVGETVLCIYGFVEYLDAFQMSVEELNSAQTPRHVTRFCYVYQFRREGGTLTNEKTGKSLFPAAFCVGGPEAYNRVT